MTAFHRSVLSPTTACSPREPITCVRLTGNTVSCGLTRKWTKAADLWLSVALLTTSLITCLCRVLRALQMRRKRLV